MRALHPLEQQLRTSPSLDTPARQAALEAVNAMLNAGTRAGVLLDAARKASVAEGGRQSTARGRSAVLAQEAYEAWTSAEVAKYRAAFALMAEEHGAGQVMSTRRAKAEAENSRLRPVFIQKAQYHERARDSMLRAAAATSAALKAVPPLPEWVASKAQAVPTGPVETAAFPMLGWRPKKYNDMMYEFFPREVRKAAGGLSGDQGGGLGVAADAVVGPTEPWYNALLKSIGFGVQAVGKAAADAGSKQTGQNPASAGALTTGGNIVASLSTLLTGAVGRGQSTSSEVVPQSVGLGSMVLVGGAVAMGGFLLWKFSKGFSKGA